jgi:hypothetical protein
MIEIKMNLMKFMLYRDFDMLELTNRLKEVRKNMDYLSKGQVLDMSTLTEEEQVLHEKAKAFYEDAWKEQLSETIGKSSLENFSDDAPIKILDESLEKVVLSSVMRLIKECKMKKIYKTVMLVNADKIYKIGNEYAEEIGKKNIFALTPSEMKKVHDIFADNMLKRRMECLPVAFELFEMYKLQKQMSADEDFNEKVLENHDKIDHVRRTQHTRTKSGASLSLDELQENNSELISDSGSSVEEAVETKSMSEWEQIFLSVLNDEEKKIFKLLQEKKTQEEIASELGYESQSAISKKKKKMEEKIRDEIARQNM